MTPEAPESEAQIEIKRLEENEEFLERAVHLVLGCCDASDVPCEERDAGVLYEHVRHGTAPQPMRAVAAELDRLTAEVALLRERDRLTRKALRHDGDGPLQFAALIVRQQRDKALAEVSRLREQLAAQPTSDLVERAAIWLFRAKTSQMLPDVLQRASTTWHRVLGQRDRDAWVSYAREMLADLGWGVSSSEVEAPQQEDEDERVPTLAALKDQRRRYVRAEGRPSGSGRLAPRSGVKLIADERARQVAVEGWTPEHDAEHDNDDLVRAASCYLTPPEQRQMMLLYDNRPVGWPWGSASWKPSADRVRELVKAGALIAAEIDRRQAQDAALAARSEATRFVCSEHIWDSIPCPNCEPRNLPSPSLRKEGGDSEAR